MAGKRTRRRTTTRRKRLGAGPSSFSTGPRDRKVTLRPSSGRSSDAEWSDDYDTARQIAGGLLVGGLTGWAVGKTAKSFALGAAFLASTEAIIGGWTNSSRGSLFLQGGALLGGGLTLVLLAKYYWLDPTVPGLE